MKAKKILEDLLQSKLTILNALYRCLEINQAENNLSKVHENKVNIASLKQSISNLEEAIAEFDKPIACEDCQNRNHLANDSGPCLSCIIYNTANRQYQNNFQRISK